MPKVYCKEDLAKEVQDLLGLSPTRLQTRASKDYKVVTAIVNSITEALHRGERVRISGFGTFRAETVPARNRQCGYFYTPGNKHPHQEIRNVPSKTRIRFYPAKDLKRLVNEGVSE